MPLTEKKVGEGVSSYGPWRGREKEGQQPSATPGEEGAELGGDSGTSAQSPSPEGTAFSCQFCWWPVWGATALGTRILEGPTLHRVVRL